MELSWIGWLDKLRTLWRASMHTTATPTKYNDNSIAPITLPSLDDVHDIVGANVDVKFQYLKVYLLGKALMQGGKPIHSPHQLQRQLHHLLLYLKPHPIFFTRDAAERYCQFTAQRVGVYCIYAPELAIVGDKMGLTMRLEYVQPNTVQGCYPLIQDKSFYLTNPSFDTTLIAKTQMAE